MNFITALIRQSELPYKEPLVECECGCGRLYPASQMTLYRTPGTRRIERVFSLHFAQIWGTYYGNLPQK